MQLIISSILIATTEIISMSYFITINVLLVWFRTWTMSEIKKNLKIDDTEKI